MSDRVKIKLDLTRSDYTLLRAWCKQRGLSFEEWATSALLAVAAGKLPPPPAVTPVPEPEELHRQVVAEDNRHPCVWLRPESPANFSRRDCEGTCTAPRQDGTPCFWGPASAPSCRFFRRKLLRPVQASSSS